MELQQTGGCRCGALRYEMTQAPIMVYTCHCTDCQRITSSAFSLGCVLPDAAFRLVRGEPKGVQRTTGSGRVSTRWVCPECGVWVCAAPRPGATVRNVRGGTLDDTSWLWPTAHIWTRSKQPWVSLPEGIRNSRRSPQATPGGVPSLLPAEPPSEELTPETLGEDSDARLLGAGAACQRATRCPRS